MKGAIFVLLGIFLLLGVFADPILDGVKTWRTEDTTDSFVVTTGAGVTTANVTLTRDLFQDETSEVIAITSNISGETPISSSYATDTNYLLLSALNPSASHLVSVNYYSDSDSTVMAAVGPFIGVLIIGGLVIAMFLGRKH